MNSSSLRRWMMRGAGLIASLSCAAGVLAESAVPEGLRGWEAWVLRGAEAEACPWLLGQNPAALGQRVCGWPGTLTLDVGSTGAGFRVRWTVAAEAWVPLPGDLTRWPENVTVNGAPAALVARDGLPQLRLAAGTHEVGGQIRWAERPAELPVPADIGLVDLSIDGRRIAATERAGSLLLLGVRRAAADQDQLTLKVFRLVEDQSPGFLVTQLQLQVAGEAREVRLPPSLPAGYVPVALQSGLPARIDADGSLRLQVRAGSHEIRLTARAPGVIAKVGPPKLAAPWPGEEVWSVAADDRLRVMAVEGATGVDPGQAGVPADWSEYPAYALAGGAELTLSERSRGLAVQDANELTLKRDLWLDFDRRGFTAVDQLSGRMRQGWRLEMQTPYAVTSARDNGNFLLVTQIGKDRAGVEVREPALDLRTAARLEERGSVPATGWNQRFNEVSGVLHLPPGNRLLAAFGVDSAPGAWLERWHLLDIFLVLLIATAAWRLAGIPLGVIALGALLFTYQESLAPTWLWVSLIVALALARAAPEGMLRRLASGYRLLSFALVILALLPFAANQARLALFPQLEFSGWSLAPMLARLESSPASAVEAPSQEVYAEADSTALPAAPPAPALMAGDLATRASQSAASSEEEIVMTARKRTAALRYAPGSLVQTGPGLPDWRYGDYDYAWSGPVEPEQTAHFLILPPWAVSLWRIAGLVLSVMLLVGLLRFAFDQRPRLPPRLERLWSRWLKSPGTVAPAVLLLAVLGALGSPGVVQAASTPDPQLLSELRERLLAAPRCLPACAEVLNARAATTPDGLELVLDVSTLSRVAVPLPNGEPHWQPASVAVDGEAAGVYRDAGGTRWVALDRGRHVVRITGGLAAVEGVRIAFPAQPRRIDVGGSGWTPSGVVDRRLASGALELSRLRTQAADATFTAGNRGEFEPFVRVVRTLRLDLDWSVTTRVERVAPQVGAFTVRVPLLKGEGLRTSGLDMRDGEVLAAFASGEYAVAWDASLQQAAQLELSAGSATTRTEVWVFAVSPVWHAEFSGLPAITPEDPASELWSFEYYPRAGETLRVDVTRPEAAPGGTLAFDRVSLSHRIGKRAATAELSLVYRSTQGGRHLLRLPADARVTLVEIDGEAVPVRPEKGELPIAVLPGDHEVRVNWESPAGVRPYYRAPEVAVGAPASNLDTALILPADRWVLYARGAGVGPAILYWGELLIFLCLAFWLGRSGLTPLGVRDWLLLGLGLSTFSWFALALFAAWIFALRWREIAPATWTGSRYNLRQVALGLLTVAALGGLVAAVPQGLLAQPDMRIEQVGGGAEGLHWFLDRTDSALPSPFVISVSLWWYKLAMLLWALWLSFAVTRWVKWAWGLFIRDGLWQKRGMTIPPPASPTPSP